MTELSAVLRQYGLNPARARITPVTTGFSGAGVWRVGDGEVSYVLKRWPADQPVYLKLDRIHEHMKRARGAGLHFVPEVISNHSGVTVTESASSQWDLMSWMPGVPTEAPDMSRARSAVRAVLAIHAVWSDYHGPNDQSHGIVLRHRRLTCWTGTELEQLRIQTASQPLFRRAWHCFHTRREKLALKLMPCRALQFPVQRCLGDVWSDHVLFTGDQVTGIVDFGGMRYDHPAHDLARLLGSYRLSRQEMVDSIAAYPGAEAWCDLMFLLIDTGRVAAIANWLRWLVLEKWPLANREAALRRLACLVEQVEGTP